MNLNISRAKDDINKLQQVLEQGRVIEHIDCFYFTQITDKKLAISLQKLAIFNIYHTFTSFVKLHGCRFLYFFGLSDVRNEAVFLILEHSSPGGLNRKNTRKNMRFWSLNPHYKRSNSKTWLPESFSEALISKLGNKKNTCCRNLQKWSEIELYSTPYGFIKNIRLIHLRASHVKFTGKNEVGNNTWAKYVAWLV